ncbi:MAG TPA: hypothetical protein VD865_13080 [Stenotrophomonas sp.]|nr:hypothetical protein [Stenotrophomonas sp.]
MKSAKEVSTDVLALQAVVTVLARRLRSDKDFHQHVRQEIEGIASELSADEAEALRQAATVLTMS